MRLPSAPPRHQAPPIPTQSRRRAHHDAPPANPRHLRVLCAYRGLAAQLRLLPVPLVGMWGGSAAAAAAACLAHAAAADGSAVWMPPADAVPHATGPSSGPPLYPPQCLDRSHLNAVKAWASGRLERIHIRGPLLLPPPAPPQHSPRHQRSSRHMSRHIFGLHVFGSSSRDTSCLRWR